jgi:GST-like protein
VSTALEVLDLPYQALPDHSVADIAIFPWVRNLVRFYEPGDLVCFADSPEVARVLAACVVLPAVVRRLAIPG